MAKVDQLCATLGRTQFYPWLTMTSGAATRKAA